MFRDERKLVIALSIFAALAIWVIDAFVSSIILHGESFMGHLGLDVSPHEIWLRLIVFAILAVYGALFSRILAARKRAEQALRERQRSLEASNARLAEMTQEMQQFLYLASHDLRSPLVTIEGFASRLLTRHAEECGDEARHSLERIRAGVHSMARLIESLLRLSRANTAELKPAALDMGEVVAEVARDLEQLAADAGVRFDIQPDLPPAWGDRRAAHEILLNLVTNGIKYRGDIDPCVWIRGQPRDGGMEFAVRDNGIGIEADKLDSVFQMFTRAEASGRPGLGIGLTGAKRLVERHGGRIWVESVRGQGSTFHFILPNQEASDGQGPPAARDPAGRGRSRPCRVNA